jgi:hypothetical protein
LHRIERSAIAVAVAVLVGLSWLPAARAADPPPNSVWTEHYFPSADGVTQLHADVLRPEGLDDKDKTPVILTVSPYFNHGDSGGGGPSDRFYDFLEVSDILERGYTYVMVDLPGFGGSGGCNDWGGVREQAGAKSAVEWAASQPWSTGKVGMMGKSYDAWTGLMAMAQKPKGLAAVVSMEPVYSGYRYLYNNGVRFTNSVLTPTLFQVYDAQPGTPQDGAEYNAYGAPQFWCYGVNLGLQQQDDESSAFWKERDLLEAAKGSKTPLFLTQGFLESNTKPDAAFDFFNLMKGDDNRAWYGQFDHVRGWETGGEGEYLTGRDTFVEEMMRFFDHHVKGVPLRDAPVHKDATIEVQDALGRYRHEPSWPPPDMSMRTTKLEKGTFADDGSNSGSGGGGGRGIWTISQPLKHDAWLSGEPVLKLSIDAVPRANVVGNVYDVAPNGRATLVTRGAFLVRGAGPQEIEFELYGQDWPLEAGHRIGVLVSGANSEWWVHVPTGTDVTVSKGAIDLPFLQHQRTRFVEGKATSRLKSHLSSAYVTVSDGTVRAARTRFDLPPRLVRR